MWLQNLGICRCITGAPSKARPCQPGIDLTPEALARHRRPSVAWLKATTVMERTQRADGPQYASMKGLSPFINKLVGADMGSDMEGSIQSNARRARREPGTIFTALMHHFTAANLRACYETFDGTKAPGLDGVTKAMYGQHLDDNLRALHQKLRQLAYRPQPMHRVEIRKEDGTTPRLGISCTADEIVQELTRRTLETTDEPGFCDTSYDFRPGRSCNAALRRLNREVMSVPVNWVPPGLGPVLRHDAAHGHLTRLGRAHRGQAISPPDRADAEGWEPDVRRRGAG